MFSPDPYLLFMLVTAAAGALLFVRLVAKEKHRRDKYLQLRVIEKAKALEEAEKNKTIELQPRRPRPLPPPVAAPAE